MKKWLCIIVVLALLLGVLAGCGSKPTDVGADTGSASGDNPAVGQAKDWLDISVGWDGAMVINDDPLGKWLQEKLKIRFQPVSVNGDKLKLLATTDELPDIIETIFGDPVYNQFKSEDFIREIPEVTLANYPNVKKMCEASVYWNAFKKMNGGKIWGIIHPGIAKHPAKGYPVAFTVRWDWAQKMGVTKLPETVDEFYNLLKMYRNNDPDGNGQKDTYGFTGYLWSVHYIPWGDIYSWQKENGQWVPGYLANSVVPALKWWNRLVQEDIMPGDFANADDMNEFMNDKLGSFQQNGGQYHLWDKLIVRWQGSHQDYLKQIGRTTQDCLKQLAPLKLDANTPARWTFAVENACTAISSKVNDAKLARILELYEFLLSPEGIDLMNFGFKDKDYKIIDGKAFSMLPPSDTKFGEKKKIWELYPSVQIAQIVAWGLDYNTLPQVDIFPDWIIKLDKDIQAKADAATVVPNIAITRCVTPAREKNPVVDSYQTYEPDLMKIIAGKNVDKDFAAMKKKYLEVDGVQKVIDEVNAKVKSDNLETVR